MKVREIKELHTKSVDELRKLLKEAEDILFSMKMDLKQFKLKDTSSMARKRDDIARISSILRGKELSKNG